MLVQVHLDQFPDQRHDLRAGGQRARTDVACTGAPGRLVEVGIPVHRFSGDTFDYPHWSTEEAANVFDPVAAVYYNAATGGSGWRRESYDVRSVPVSEAETKRYISSGYLLRGH